MGRLFFMTSGETALKVSKSVTACAAVLGLFGCTSSHDSGAPAAAQYSVAEEAVYQVRRFKHAVWSAIGLSNKAIVSEAVRFVKFEADTEIHGGPWTAVAEFNLLDAKGKRISRQGWSVSADSVAVGYPVSNVIDGDDNSFWHSKFKDGVEPLPHSLVIDLGSSVPIGGFSYVPRQDGNENGNVARYRIFASNDRDRWGNALAIGNLSAQKDTRQEQFVIFATQSDNLAPKIEAISNQSSSQYQPVSVALSAKDPDGDALEFAATGLPDGIAINSSTGALVGRPRSTGQFASVVTVTDLVGNSASSSFVWTVTPTSPDAVGFVRLEALTEIAGAQWTAVAEFNVLDANGAAVPRNDWTITADNSEATTGPEKAIDGDVSTIWHTTWSAAEPPQLPHNLIVNLGGPVVISGFRYLPRQDETRSGTIGLYRFYVSEDGVHWGQPVVQGDFASLGAPNSEKTVYLK